MSGHPIILVHGLIGSLDSPALRRLLSRYELFAPPLLGYGRHREAPLAAIDAAGQAAHLTQLAMERYGSEPVHLVGHSVGGVVAALAAAGGAMRVASIVSVEGNFTLNDAFWSRKIAAMPAPEAEALLAGHRADPAGWLAQSGVASSAEHVRTARAWLAAQPASTLQAMARSVVAVTGPDGYRDMLRGLFEALPVHLIAGERSRAGWDVPGWARKLAASDRIVPRAGHMMMLDNVEDFGRLVAQAVSES